jgi:hypothetical protein
LQITPRRLVSGSFCRRGIIEATSLLLLTVAGRAQGPALSPGDVPRTTIERNATYNGKALYGYIDGGAELYYEYGFRRATVQEVVQDSLRIHLEIFEMDSPEGAAGIFSVTNQGCLRDSFWDFKCASRFQAQSARGRYFIRAANVAGTPAEEALTRAVARLAVSKAGDTVYTPPSLFLDSLFQQGRESFMVARGPLGVQNGLPDWADFVEELGEFQLSVLIQEAGGVATRIGLLETSEHVDIPVVRNWIEDAPRGLSRIALADGPRRLLLCETSADQKRVDACRAVMERHRTE